MKRSEASLLPIHIKVDPDFKRAINDWRRRQPDIPALADAVRTLVSIGLKTTAESDKAAA
jgi:hypothetical protein